MKKLTLKLLETVQTSVFLIKKLNIAILIPNLSVRWKIRKLRLALNNSLKNQFIVESYIMYLEEY